MSVDAGICFAVAKIACFLHVTRRDMCVRSLFQ